MSYTIFNKKVFNVLEQPMFFGESVNVSRYDQQRYPIFEKLIEKQLSFFWRPEEVDLSRDRSDYNTKLTDPERHIFISNLKYQTLLDSVQGRSPNVALLPIVSLPELETWIETWSFSECLAEGTEVLTSDGWKDLSEVDSNVDECLVYNLKNDTVFFEKPKRVAEFDVDTDLVEFKSKNSKQFHQVVTPNHRMPVIHRDVRNDGTQKRYFNDAIFQDYKPHHLAPMSGFLSKSGDALSPLDRLKIATQADGTVSDRYTGERSGMIPIWFTFKKDRKIERLYDICHKGGFDIIELSECKTGRRFKVSIPVDKYTCDFKRFDWVVLNNVSVNFCNDFVEELSHWDSHRYDGGKQSFSYTTTVKENADVVQAICAMCGKQPRLSVKKDERKETYSDTYNINVVYSNTKDGQSIEKRYVKYRGKVRCLETSTGAFLIRYNGVVSVTGNTIHSRSYTHIIRNIVNDPSVVFDDIVANEEITKRAISVSKYYDDLIELVGLYNSAGLGVHNTPEKGDVEVSMKTLKKALYLTVASVNILEAVRFYVSFACSFSFAERTLMEGNAKIIKLIARDEALHLNGTQHMLNLMASGRDDPEMAVIAKEVEDEVIKMFEEAAQQEKDWAKYLFKDGSMIGLNYTILSQYVEYITNTRMQAVGLPKLFETTSNPIPWVNAWLVSDNVQVAPQEAEISSYLVGQIDSSLEENEFDSFGDL